MNLEIAWIGGKNNLCLIIKVLYLQYEKSKNFIINAVVLLGVGCYRLSYI
jgi:hypothetical protein